MIRASTRKDLVQVAAAAVLAAALGAIYGAYRHPMLWVGVLTGAATGLVVCGGLVGLEQLVFARHSARLARRPIWQIVVCRLAVYLAVTLAGVRLGHLSGDVFLPPEHAHGIELSVADVTVSFLVALAFVLFTDLDRFLGGRVILDMLLGRQLKPHREDRLFLLADVVGSTAISQRLGDVAFHAFLNDVFFDVSEPVAAYRGTVYRYVGDMIIVTWPAELDDAAERTVRCALAMCRLLAARGEKYQARYGVVPELRFALHAGTVVAGEMGHLRREIVYLGTTLNAAAHLERLASGQQCRVAASARLVQQLRDLPEVCPRRVMRSSQTGIPDLGDVFELVGGPERADQSRRPTDAPSDVDGSVRRPTHGNPRKHASHVTRSIDDRSSLRRGRRRS